MTGSHIESNRASGTSTAQRVSKTSPSAIIAVGDNRVGSGTTDIDAGRRESMAKVFVRITGAGLHREKERRCTAEEIRIRCELQSRLTCGNGNDSAVWNFGRAIVLEQPAVGDAGDFEVSHLRSVNRITIDYQPGISLGID